MHIFFTFSTTLLAYVVGAFSLSPRADSPRIIVPVTKPRPPAPQGFNITSLSLNGSGCPPGSVNYTLNADRNTINVTFSEYFARIGPGIPISSTRKNCQLGFGVSIPPGSTYSLDSIDYRSYSQLDVNVTACQQIYLYFNETVSQDLAGPIFGNDYTYHDGDFMYEIHAPCVTSSIMYITSDIRTNNTKNSNGSGWIGRANDSVGARKQCTIVFSDPVLKRPKTDSASPSTYIGGTSVDGRSEIWTRLIHTVHESVNRCED